MRYKMHNVSSRLNNVGYPNIFLRITCNPQWPGIKKSLLRGQSVTGRPDITARIFRIKLRAIMAFIIDGKIFRDVKTYVRVIGFRKQEKPHAHCISFKTPASKVKTLSPTFVTAIISAKILGKGCKMAVLVDCLYQHNKTGSPEVRANSL